MTRELRGVVHGRTIELDQAPELPDGQVVFVQLLPESHLTQAETAPQACGPREALARSAGAWSDDPEGLASFLDWTRAQRAVSRPELET